jgi:hypothetical protein
LSEQTELQASSTGANGITAIKKSPLPRAKVVQRAGELRQLLHQKIDTVVYEVQSLAAQERKETTSAGR